MSISSSITSNIYRGIAQTTPDAQTQAKADRKKARQAKRLRKAEGVMGAIGNFAESVAAGLEAEGLRRHKMGLSGAGFAAAFGAGASEIIDFGKLQKAKRKSALAQKLGFVPADAGSDDDIQKIIDALTEYEASQNARMAVEDTTTEDDADDDAGDEEKPNPLDQNAPQDAGEPDDQTQLKTARDENQTPPGPLKTGNAVLDNVLESESESEVVYDLYSIPGLQRNISMENN